MSNKVPKQLYPSILTDSLTTFAEQVAMARELEGVETIQVDVIDGFFADDVTVSPLDIFEMDFGELKIDFHFMVNEPVDFILETQAFSGELPVRAMIGQVERMGSQSEYLAEVKRLDWKTGLSLDLHTPLEAIDDDSWAKVDVLQIMGIEAGAQGQAFVPLVLEKIAEARKVITSKKLDIEIVVDGGVKLENAQKIIAAGANSVAVGSALWQTPEPEQVVTQMSSFLAKA